MMCNMCEWERGSHRHDSFGLQQGIDAKNTLLCLFFDVKCIIYGSTRWPEEIPEKGKAMDTLGVMIAVVPVVRTTDLGAL